MSGYTWAVLGYFVLKILISVFIPVEYKNQSDVALSSIGLALILIGLWNLFITKNRLRHVDEIATNENMGGYFKIVLLLSFTRLDSFGNFGSIGYMSITLSLLLFCAFIVLREAILTRTLVNGVIIGHLVFGYLLYNWSKNTFVRNYGNEIIGSFWEKPDYRTKYIVKVSESRDFTNAYTLHAQVHVSTVLEESDYPQEDAYGNEYFESYSRKYIIIEKIFWPNGGVSVFDFCDIEESNYCVDQNDNWWYIKIDKKL